ncbi:PREDICTED: interleukin-13 receptor subunit alpha-1 [Gekko japonicus]|uniref:Interleukin-13 receptor subunit alpha-1 n=1 Tax=Gekko japonicus TaxID=146911 RepID=A0ABM1KDG5_GEKJA|nr:PREDICTED: interleukin-13 receptor subunit alpha-1 [Gekko japonicus]
MEARELLLIAFAGAVIRECLPYNVTYHIDEKSCSGTDATDFSEDLERCLKNTYWEENVALGEKIAFDVETSCQKNCEDVSARNYDVVHHVQYGAAGTGARNVTCVWLNRNYMKCSWRAGEKASPDTSYRMSYWLDSNGEAQPCTNITHSGSEFQCGFLWIVGNVQLITISIQGNSGNIQPICWLSRSINCLVKLDPPVLSLHSKNGSEVVLRWTKPVNLYRLNYEVEVDHEHKHRPSVDADSATIQVKPDVPHTFRVRVKSTAGHWSEWSNTVEDGRTSKSLLLLVLIPLCVALLLVILLIYLKRIKLWILPKIPDPEKILKHMFEEQNENQPTHETANNEETHSLMIVDPAGNEK